MALERFWWRPSLDVLRDSTMARSGRNTEILITYLPCPLAQYREISGPDLEVLTSLIHRGLGLRFPCNDLTLG